MPLLFERLSLFSLLIVSFSGAQTITKETSCAAGEYLRDGIFCVACEPGYKCPGGAFNYPIACQPGEYSGYGESSCNDCKEGWECPTPAAIPTPCASGEFAPAKSTSCTACAAGMICYPDGTYDVCLPGETCPLESPPLVRKLDCPAGSKCPSANVVAPVACSAGQYAVQGSAQCSTCPKGHYCPSTDHAPIPCPGGWYADVTGQTICQDCPAGHECSDATLPPQACAAGEYNPIGGMVSCFTCPQGSKCDDASSWPTPCSASEYAVAGSTECNVCPAGKSCANQGAPADCGSGEYSFLGSLDCTTCPAGYSCADPKLAPKQCQPGYFSAPGSTSCTECAVDEQCPTGSDVPAACYDGAFAPAGSTSCSSCPAGANCSGGAVTPCAAGQVTSPDGGSCEDCPAGFACPLGLFKKMVACGPGYWSDTGEDACSIAEPGKYAPTTIAAPVDVDDGFISHPGMTYQLRCPPGSTCKEPEGVHVVMCPPGSYYKKDERTCTKCEAGKYCPVAIGGFREEGIDCPPGTFSLAGRTECTICLPGHECPGASDTEDPCTDGKMAGQGYASCEACPANYECAQGDKGDAIAPCPPFHWQDFATHAGECKPCPDGADCTDLQAATKPSCGPGFFASAYDWTCQVCPKGHFCGDGVAEPTPCAPGTYSNDQATVCTDCPAEYYSLEGSQYCTPVPPGWETVDVAGKRGAIQVCGSQFYSEWGQESCQACPDGFLCPEMTGHATQNHLSCPRGSYCIAGVQYKCPAGKYGIMERGQSEAQACADCPAGYNCVPGTEHFELSPCPRGGYCPPASQVIPCPAGTYNEMAFAKSVGDCKECEAGRECGGMSIDKGVACEQGYFCPKGSAPGDFPCPKGTYGGYRTGKKDLGECLPCPPGHYCPEATADPVPAPAGKYTPLTGIGDESALFLCPPKYYCDETGMTNYKGKICAPGHVCPAGSTSATGTPCPEGTWSDRNDLHDVKQCLPCPKGYRCAAGATQANGLITECVAGMYCPEGTPASLDNFCPSGTRSPYTRATSLEDCIPCVPGTYCEAGMPITTCPEGHYCPEGTRSANQFPCPEGYYNDITGKTNILECLHCGEGNYCPNKGMTAPLPCAAGSYNDYSTTALYCQQCPAGYFCDVSELHPQLCDIGRYSAAGQTSSPCPFCPVGSFCPMKGTSESQMLLNKCPEGTYCSQDDGAGNFVGLTEYPNKNDHACPIYQYCPRGTKSPLDIPRGTTILTLGRGDLSDAIQLPAGWYKADISVGTCSPGYYCPAGSYEEVPCPAGFFRTNVFGMDVTDCGVCPAGYYCPTPGAVAVPTICPLGKFCPEGSAEPQLCPIGTYNPNEGATDSRECTGCDAGSYCPFMGQTAIDPVHVCDAGYLCLGGSSRPEPTDFTTGRRCPAGGYCNQGTAVVQSCPTGQVGFYDGASAIAECFDCTPGFYCNGDFSTGAALPCTEGYICPAGTATPTVQPQPGEYAPQGSAFALLCPRGTYSITVGAVACTNCEAGFFCDGVGISVRTNCPKGYYCPSFDTYNTLGEEYRMKPCPKGYYNNIENKGKIGDCILCPAGKACDEEGMAGDPITSLPDCAEGFYCIQGAETRFPETERLPALTYYGPCPAGYWCAAATSTPTACGIGTYNPQVGAVSIDYCLPCPPGKTCSVAGLAAPDGECLAGFTCIGGTVNNEFACNAQTHCPLASHFELICPTGFYQSIAQKGFCEECSPGSYCMFSEIAQCPSGYYCP